MSLFILKIRLRPKASVNVGDIMGELDDMLCLP
jgi:hypothetical protein